MLINNAKKLTTIRILDSNYMEEDNKRNKNYRRLVAHDFSEDELLNE